VYSRNRSGRLEPRYAENVPSLYGGSRFYRQETAGDPSEIRPEDVRAAVSGEGTPVQYEAAPKIQPVPEVPCETETPPDDPTKGSDCTAKEDAAAAERKKPEGLLASVFADPEELLLLGLLLLFCLENERCVDVIVILLLLLIVH